MAKLVSYFFSFICIIVVEVLVIAFIVWTRVPGILSKDLSEKLQVDVKVEDAKLGWNAISVSNISIGNPPNSILPKAFSCEEILIENSLPEYLSDDIVVELITLKDIYLGLEFASPTGAKGNWTEIMSNLNRTQSPSTEKKGSSKTLLIEKIVLENINVDVVYATQPTKIKRLPTIERMEITNISSEGGFPTEQITKSVLGQMLKSVFIKENLSNMLNDLLDPSKNPVDSLIKPFKGFFNAKDSSKESLSA